MVSTRKCVDLEGRILNAISSVFNAFRAIITKKQQQQLSDTDCINNA